MKENNGFLMLAAAELPAWLEQQKVARRILRVQEHHTWSPEYKHFTGSNHFTRQAGMRQSHLARGFSDIAQHFTIFPDGAVLTGRPLDEDPAGIVGANTGAICIEHFGNFDIGQDVMDERQARASAMVTAALCSRFGLRPESDITYHGWWTADGVYLGDYDARKSAKTCPGTAFFGGNTQAAFRKYYLPRVKAAMEGYGFMDYEGFKAFMERYEREHTYRYVQQMPDWAQDTFARLIQAGYIAKDEKGEVSVPGSSLQPMVWLDRLTGGKLEKLPEMATIVETLGKF